MLDINSHITDSIHAILTLACIYSQHYSRKTMSMGGAPYKFDVHPFKCQFLQKLGGGHSFERLWYMHWLKKAGSSIMH